MSLKAAIEAVYDTFSDIAHPPFVDGCQCCMTADEYETLTAKPLRELSSLELNEYAADVMLTMGSEEEYPYFLPRILELTIEDDGDWLTSIEITAEKIRMARFDTWSERKRNATNDLWRQAVIHFSTSESDPEMFGFAASDVDSWLAAATIIPIPTSPLLVALESSPGVLRELYNMNFETLFRGQLKNAFLDGPSEGQAEITAWLRNRISK